jgi:predicted Ser/Thr protein kinase/CheY-like chemotaxis protein
MAEIDPEILADQAVNVGLVTSSQLRQAREAADDGSAEALLRSMMRKGMLTSWQRDRLMKGDVTGFFFGGCRVLFHLAEGTFARVYRGQREGSGQSVAVKVLRRRFGMDPAAVARFDQEAEAGMRLSHPNIVKIYDHGEQDKQHYMTMEYVEGSNLRDFLKIRKRLTADEALPFMLGLAHGMKYSLDQGVTHRDIKGTNVLIGHRGEAKLVDFGLATVGIDERAMEAAHGQRTVDYSALERTCGSPKGDPRSDIYFLGCVFYQMLTGQPAMAETETHDPLAKMLKRSFGAIKPISEHRSSPPPALAQVIEKMMKVELRLRYQTMDEVVADLESYRDEAEAQTRVHPTLSAAAVEVSRPEPVRVAAPQPDDSGVLWEDDDPFEEVVLEPKDEVAHESEAVVQKQVLCVEVQEPVQAVFRKTMSAMGYRVILVRDAERAAERYRESPPDAVVFDADGLGPEALDAFIDMHEKAHEDGHELAALVLLGPRQRQLSERLPTDDRLIVLSKPMKMKDVQDALTQLVPLD